jgi:negative regulator of flagellin synthesis FlgM
MKITNGIASVGTGTDSGRTKSTTQKSSTPANQASDQVELSPLASQLHDASTSVGEPIDTARIAEIKQAISDGRFQVNPERIADGVLESVRQLLASR